MDQNRYTRSYMVGQQPR